MTQLNEEGARLQDGIRPDLRLEDVRVRPYGVTDGPRLRRMSDRLSPASLFARFFTGSPHIPETYVHRLEGIDHWDHEALVALLDDDIVGVAEYVRDRADPRRAELAVLVVDPWQHRGVGRLLVCCLAHTALRRGVTAFGAEILPDNRAALAAVRSCWPFARPRYADGSAVFHLPLLPAAA
ncbi:GNAT family N-acetyltransferase [Thermomonospora catenispora]|uniref:GNAT family N-acetyltransferase n=1 Tax=Thermomonospora catenispora TaxID=2493090 RepID=UPI00111FF7A1|nr:GNAT family N-acetyltransferase [Thermomonospora catenispora]TNY38126.1 GNAT family N-acetyltransferase [Thermomonospora catenispora]